MAGRADASDIIINIFDNHLTENWHGGWIFFDSKPKIILMKENIN